MPQRARPPPWNNIKLFVPPEPPPPARALSLFVTSLKTFTFKSFSRCPLHYSTTKTSLCGFLGNLKDPFVPRPLLSLSSPETPSCTPRICTTASYSRCRCKSRNFPWNSLNNSSHTSAFWPRYESSRERNELFDFATRVFLMAYPLVYYSRSLVCMYDLNRYSISLYFSLF